MSSQKSLKRHVTAILWALAAQYLAGMATNLFVTVPKVHPGTQGGYFSGLAAGVGWALSSGTPLLQVHVALGLLLFFESTVIGVLALSAKSGITWAAIIGWIGVVGAGFNGGSYLNYGHDFSSMIMATTFGLAATAYVWAAIALARDPDLTPGPH